MVRATMNKTAFTMIELIFAIVIIAVSVMSLPMMTQVTSSGIEKNLLQEAVFAASAQLSEATTYTWDERSTNDLNISELSKVINTSTGGCTSASNNRPGNINRECLNDLSIRPDNAPSASGSSIDTAAYSTPTSILVGTGASANSYKQNYKSTLIVTQCISGNTYVPLNSSELTNENVKQLEYKIIDPDDGNTLVILRAYSTNIGEVVPASTSL
jgi:type II secretory pathway pseudopilin PulG